MTNNTELIFIYVYDPSIMVSSIKNASIHNIIRLFDFEIKLLKFKYELETNTQIDWSIQFEWFWYEMKAENLYFIKLTSIEQIKLIEIEWNDNNI